MHKIVYNKHERKSLQWVNASMNLKVGAAMRYVAPTGEVREGFHQGRNRRAYEMLGAHPVEQDGKSYWHFAVWAPNAK